MNTARTTLFLIALQCLSVIIWAQDVNGVNLEYHIKAVFLYKFSSYVEWPPSTFESENEPFVIGVIDADQVAEEVENLSATNTVLGRQVEVRRLSPDERMDDLHLLFVGRREGTRLQAILNNLKTKPVLIVTESEGALTKGSIVNFVPVNDNIRFEVSVVNADLNDIKISSRLLDVAHNVESGR